MDGRANRRSLVLLIDPRALTRDAVACRIEASAQEFRVLPTARAADIAYGDRGAECEEVGLAIVNLGGAAVEEDWVVEDVNLLMRSLPDVPIVVISDQDGIDSILEAIRRGVRGYIPTSVSHTVMIEALRAVQAGGTFVPASALQRLLREQAASAGGEPDDTSAAASLTDFTPRQIEVLALLRRGKSNKVIAYELGMRESTVKVHVRNIMRKLNATNRTEAAFLVQRLFGRGRFRKHRRPGTWRIG